MINKNKKKNRSNASKNGTFSNIEKFWAIEIIIITMINCTQHFHFFESQNKVMLH